MKEILHPEIQEFILRHEDEDPAALVLKHKEISGVDIKDIAIQISSRRKARTKLPEWYATQNIIFPPSLSMEQCSSEATARYKSKLLHGDLLIDLTAGTGVDTFYLGKVFKQVLATEQNNALAQVTQNNMVALGAKHINIDNKRAEEVLEENIHADVIYIDPARRDANAKRVFLLQDCEPDVTVLLPRLLEIAPQVLIKTAPMLDIDLSLRALKNVKEVHIVAVNNECKEVLYLVGRNEVAAPLIFTANLGSAMRDQLFHYTKPEEENALATYSLPQAYLYEPNAAALKAGAFQLLSQKFHVNKLHVNTHLYTSREYIDEFPGRHFKILDILPYNKKPIAKALKSKKANIATRNFPDDVKNIRKKLGIQDGGDIYLFAFTDMENNKRIAITEKVKRDGQ